MWSILRDELRSDVVTASRRRTSSLSPTYNSQCANSRTPPTNLSNSTPADPTAVANRLRNLLTGLTAATSSRMAWQSSGASNAALIANLAANGQISSERVREAMSGVDRAHYAASRPYDDAPQRLGHGATISAPHMHAAAAEALLPRLHPAARVLDVGAGSGYLTHVLARLVGPGGRVVGVEHVPQLVELARENMRRSAEGAEMVESGRVEFVRADGRLGWGAGAPYDAIHVGAAAAEAHQELIAQLRAPGRLFIPVGDGRAQFIYVIDKLEDGSVKREKQYGVRYVPLTDAPGREEL